ncbi:DUF1624 domain-containing protein [Eudoraea chungangensis]|uniref:DUF1624 domain-containing protein n=1 Tax=Eudoraea chungangensis TaxID=1481905 RepID=UPI0023ECFDF2|nr:heparan-alpha-glucosaminide N-acetyltransferase domain-containing protein [Eudoraea chungangensis]
MIKPTSRKRIASIDMLRGLVIILMALDHVRDYFHADAFLFEPNDLTQTTGAIFWTRFITHYCAPVFVFLAGTSAFFVGQKRDKHSLAKWLLKRGVWLIIAEFTIIKFAWFFKLDYQFLHFLVIWILGVCMIFLAGFIYLPRKLTIALCLIGIFGHNLLDNYSPSGELASIFWNFLHQFALLEYQNTTYMIIYVLIPWVFVMPLGYYMGELYLPKVETPVRRKRLMQWGIGMVVVFLAVRLVNIYGDLVPWSAQDSLSLTIMSFFNVSKYPPSLLYLLITLGPSLVFLSLAEKWKGSFVERMVIVGRVPMFFYIIHLYLIHILALFAAIATGFSASDMVIDLWINMSPNLEGYGFGLGVVYLLWLVIIIALYPLCRKYNDYKNNNRDKWWLSYF